MFHIKVQENISLCNGSLSPGCGRRNFSGEVTLSIRFLETKQILLSKGIELRKEAVKPE